MSMLACAASLASVLSAAALYAGSAHCRWPALRALRGRNGRWLGLAFAVAALASWIAALGAGAGMCAMLGNWMLALMAMPYLGALSGADPRTTKGID